MSAAVTYLSLTVFASLIVGAATAALTWVWPASKRKPVVPLDSLGEPRSFCFRDGYLVSSERGVGFLLPQPVNRLAAWDDLSDSLSSLIPGAEAAMEDLTRKGIGFRLEGELGRDRLHLIGLRDGDEIRITMATGEAGQEAIRIDSPILAAMEEENSLLTKSHNAAPGLAWVLDAEDRVTWANGPYVEEVIRCLGPDAGAAWPIPTLFPDRETAPAGPTRRSLGDNKPGDRERWYEVVICPSENGVRHAHAQPLGRVIAAEESLRNFINTLTQTFTALPTGLAIFDANRKLVMFNPPLIDMTGLDSAWLASRPHLTEVLDSLRESQRVPEPRDWHVWRDALVAAGTTETSEPWHESWTLSGGQSFSMTARPQSDGAVAILLEDITAEMTLARRRRSDSEVLTALLDSSEDAVAAFGPDGAPLHLNALMREVAGFDIDMPPDLDAFIGHWMKMSQRCSLWSELRDLARSPEIRTEWSDTVQLFDGETLTFRVLPLSDGRIGIRAAGEMARARNTVEGNGTMIEATAGALASAGRTSSKRNRQVRMG